VTRLFGRDEELRRTGALLAAAAGGEGGALLLLGDAGIGKTSLIDAAAESAREAGMQVLRARAVEAERELPFAGLAELLAPVAARVEELAPEHAAALAGARGAVAKEAAPLAAGVGLLRLLEALAGEGGASVAVFVDDVHWLDAASLDAIFFAARRLGAERVAMLMSARPEPERGLAGRGIETLEPSALGSEDAERLLAAAGEGEELAAAARAALIESARGNPLALVAMSGALSAEERRGGAPVSEPIRPAASIERGFRAELEALPAETARALLVPAADERLPQPQLQAVLGGFGIDPGALDAAERAGVLVAEGNRLRFRHPLLRSVAYHAAPLRERVAVHAALAELDGAEDQVRRAWHLAAAATGPDEAVAAALEAAGEDSRSRGAPVEAAGAFARAAELTPPAAVTDRARRAEAAARLLAGAGQPQQALELVELGLAGGALEEAGLRGALQHLRGTVTMRSGDLVGGGRMLVEAADAVAAEDPARAGLMLLDANLADRIVGDYEAMAASARRITELTVEADPDLAALGELTGAIALFNVGEGRRAEEIIARHEAVLLYPALERFGVEALSSPAHASVWLERFEPAERILSALIDRCRERAAVTAVVYPLAVRGTLNMRRGRLRPALADAEEAVRLAAETQQLGLLAFAGNMLVEVEAALGREDACREHAAISIGVAEAVGGTAFGIYGRGALGMLELTMGRPEEAVPPLEACARAADEIGLVEPNTIQWAANYVEALALAGRTEEARAALPRLEAGFGGAWAAAALLRGRGLLAEGEEGEALLAESVAAFDAADARFEAARSRLALGERLRRSREVRRSREPLTAALTAFEAAGATPWVERAREELRASGQASAAPAAAAEQWDELTPHELRVALLVAEGRTNSEVASQLFVTRKTIEHHLSRVYRKLGLRGRTELARALASEVVPA
jgi:DNA-binding CsgD family transcriptional regulator